MMNLLSSFTDFYDGLSSDGLFFFWIIVFLFCFLIFLTIVLVVKNKKLIKLLTDEKVDILNDTVLEVPVVNKKEEDFNNNKEDVILKKEETNIQDEPIIQKEEIKVEISKPLIEKNQEETGPYKKNVLREMNARRQTSPISISKSDVIYNTKDDYNDNYGFDETCLREESISPLEDMDDSYEVNDNMKFASEIVERMEEEIKPSNIELTDYEKKQEEEAIISYDELLKVKDKIYNLTEDEETDEFIDELKSFRLDL